MVSGRCRFDSLLRFLLCFQMLLWFMDTADDDDGEGEEEED